MRASIILCLPVLAGCLFSSQGADDHFLRESVRDLGTTPLDDEAAGARGTAWRQHAADVRAQDTLSLTDCFALAMSNADELRALGEHMVQADAIRHEAIAGLLPHARFDGQYTHDSDRVEFGGRALRPRDRTEYWFTVSQTLLDGRFFPALDLAAATKQVAALRLRDGRDRLMFRTATAFYAVLGLEADALAAAAAVTRAREHHRVLRARFDAGTAQAHEVSLLNAQLQTALVAEIQTAHARDRDRARLGRLLNLQPFTATLADTLRVTGPSESVPRLVAAGLANRADLAAARAGIEQATARRNVGYADYLPKATLDLTQWTRMRDGFNDQLDWTAAIRVEWNLFDGGAREARLAGAMSRIREQEWRVKALEKTVRLEIEDALLGFQSLDLSLNAYAAAAAAAQAAEEQASRRLAEGAATPLDVLLAIEIREARARDLRRARLAHKLAALRIRLAVGDFRHVLKELS